MDFDVDPHRTAPTVIYFPGDSPKRRPYALAVEQAARAKADELGVRAPIHTRADGLMGSPEHLDKLALQLSEHGMRSVPFSESLAASLRHLADGIGPN